MYEKFEDVKEINAYVPQIKIPGFAFPFLLCDIDNINDNHIGWCDPHTDYKNHNLVDDVSSILARHDVKLDRSTSVARMFSIVKGWEGSHTSSLLPTAPSNSLAGSSSDRGGLLSVTEYLSAEASPDQGGLLSVKEYLSADSSADQGGLLSVTEYLSAEASPDQGGLLSVTEYLSAEASPDQGGLLSVTEYLSAEASPDQGGLLSVKEYLINEHEMKYGKSTDEKISEVKRETHIFKGDTIGKASPSVINVATSPTSGNVETVSTDPSSVAKIRSRATPPTLPSNPNSNSNTSSYSSPAAKIKPCATPPAVQINPYMDAIASPYESPNSTLSNASASIPRCPPSIVPSLVQKRRPSSTPSDAGSGSSSVYLSFGDSDASSGTSCGDLSLDAVDI